MTYIWLTTRAVWKIEKIDNVVNNKLSISSLPYSFQREKDLNNSDSKDYNKDLLLIEVSLIYLNHLQLTISTNTKELLRGHT